MLILEYLNIRTVNVETITILYKEVVQWSTCNPSSSNMSFEIYSNNKWDYVAVGKLKKNLQKVCT